MSFRCEYIVVCLPLNSFQGNEHLLEIIMQTISINMKMKMFTGKIYKYNRKSACWNCYKNNHSLQNNEFTNWAFFASSLPKYGLFYCIGRLAPIFSQQYWFIVFKHSKVVCREVHFQYYYSMNLEMNRWRWAHAERTLRLIENKYQFVKNSLVMRIAF